jgi:hypothetical protein
LKKRKKKKQRKKKSREGGSVKVYQRSENCRVGFYVRVSDGAGVGFRVQGFGFRVPAPLTTC